MCLGQTQAGRGRPPCRGTYVVSVLPDIDGQDRLDIVDEGAVGVVRAQDSQLAVGVNDEPGPARTEVRGSSVLRVKNIIKGTHGQRESMDVDRARPGRSRSHCKRATRTQVDKEKEEQRSQTDLKLFPELVERAKVLLNRLGDVERGGGLAAAVGLHGGPEEGVVEVLARLVEEALLVGAVSLLDDLG